MNRICSFVCVVVRLAGFFVYAGCTEDTASDDTPCSNATTKVEEQILTLCTYATNAQCQIGGYVDDMRMGLAQVSNTVEKARLVKKMEGQINSLPQLKMDSVRRRLLYSVVADLYGVMQDESYRIGGGREAVLEIWFREMEYFKSEIARYEDIAKRCAAKCEKRELDDCFGMVLSCKTEMERTYYRIDFENHVAELYCKEHPEKKAQFVQRVKNTIGRYPEWYVREQSTAGRK